MKNKVTRKDYLAGKATHREYYAQFMTPGIKEKVFGWISLEELLATGGDLKQIPLHTWDGVSASRNDETRKQFKGVGDFLTLTGSVCLSKEAARQIIEEAHATAGTKGVQNDSK